MKTFVASTLVAAVTVVLTLAGVAVLLAAITRISEMSDFVWRALLALAVFCAGSLWLLATVYLATHVAVLVFRDDERPKV